MVIMVIAHHAANVRTGVSADGVVETSIIVDICHCDDDSGLRDIVSKPASSATDEHVKDPKNGGDFVIDEEVDGGCCVELCQANCDLEGDDEEAYGRKLDGEDDEAHRRKLYTSPLSTKAPKAPKAPKSTK